MWNISEIMLPQNVADPIATDVYRSEWMFVLLMVPLLIYLIVSLAEKYSLARIINIVFSNKYASTVYRNINPGIQLFQVLLGVLSMISISTFMLFLEMHFDISFFKLQAFNLWLFNLLLISIIICFRYMVIIVVGAVTRTRGAFREYLFSISRNFKLIGILLMIVNLFISYLAGLPDKYLIYSAFALIGIILFLRLIRLVHIFLSRRFSLFYLILYLCTLEFFPALILIRYLSGQA
ncbi:MAG: DUF4271 domain-containing protein [Bacteroidota bacterium]